MAEVPIGSRKKSKQSILLFREQIASLLLTHNKSQAQLCAHLGISRSWLSKLLRGRRNMVSMRYLDEIAEYFDVEVGDLFRPVKEPDVIEKLLATLPGERIPEIVPRAPKGLGPRRRGRNHVIVESQVKMLLERQRAAKGDRQRAAKGR